MSVDWLIQNRWFRAIYPNASYIFWRQIASEGEIPACLLARL